MCDHCGCSDTVMAHDHEQSPRDLKIASTEVKIEESILSQNDRLAERNRGFFKAKKLFAVNLLSSPGSGKTSLIERTLQDRGSILKAGVVVGDLQTENDAVRIRSKGAPAVQITTGTTCHLDAHMVAHALDKLDLDRMRVLFIENVGNLVCPASFDLGEHARAVLLSVTEGEDKPLKYPPIFHNADIVLINKMDIAEAVGFQREVALANIRKIAPRATVMEVSARTGAGMETWYAWLEQNITR